MLKYDEGTEPQFKIAVTFGGRLGQLCRRLGLQWNHILLILWIDGEPSYTYESNWRGIAGHAFDKERDLAWEHIWYVPVSPLDGYEFAHLQGFCEGAAGKWYALHRWLAIAWRIVKNLVWPMRWQALALVPAETCITFVDAACRSIGRPVTSFGAAGLPDDIESSPFWKPEAM